MKDYFPDYETECNCGCGTNNFSSSFRSKLNRARVIAGIPFGLTSACRCRIKNRKDGGTDTSSHLSYDENGKKKFCEAADISVTSSRARFKILSALIEVGITRIGIGKDFIHCDDDGSKAQEVGWLY